MDISSSRNYERKGVTDYLFTYDSAYVQLYRLLLFTAGILYSFFGFLNLNLSLEPQTISYQHIGLGFTWLAIALFTYLSSYILKNLQNIAYISAYLIMLHLLYLAIDSNFSLRYIISLIVTFFISSTVFKRPAHLRTFLLANLLLIVISLSFTLDSNINKFLLINGFLIIGLFTFVILGLRLDIQEKLKTSEDLIKTAFNESADAILLVDIDKNTVADCNQRALQMFKYAEKAEFLDINVDQLFKHPLSQQDKEELNLTLEQEKVWRKQMRFKNLNSKPAWGDVAILAFTIEKASFHLYRIKDITKQKETQEQIRILESIAANVSDVIMVTDARTIDEPGPEITYVNDAFTNITGYAKEEALGHSPRFLQGPQTSKAECARIRTALEKKEPVEVELINYRKDGSEFWVNFSIAPIKDEDNNTTQFISVQRDITERKKKEDIIKSSLHEKEVLLKEIHHRVKNNMTVISSLLSIQANYIKDQEARALFEESRNRIKSMALIHDKLYQHESLANIEFSNYIQDLVGNIASSYNSQEARISVELDTEIIYQEIVKAVPCGLIINEIFSNAYKHAFKGRREGNIKISFRKNGEYCQLTISDNGKGLPEGFDIHNSSSLGMQLILALVEQLSGTLDIIQHEGTTFKLTFKQ
jgi:PAS domain S-box-containing protein